MHKDERLGRDSVMEVARLRLGGFGGRGEVESYYATPVLLVPHSNLLVVGSEK